MKLGTYRYSYAVSVYPTLQLSRFYLRVEVLAEEHRGTASTLWYQIRFMEFHADKRGPDTVTWVKATSVKLDGQIEINFNPKGGGWLPYKD